MISEWDPILTPSNQPYMELRLNNGSLEVRFVRMPSYIVRMDERVIPQLIKALQRTIPLEDR